MYATKTNKCPVASPKLLLSKTSPNATSLFNHCAKEAISDVNQKIWYTDKSVKKYQFTKFMCDISRNAKCKQRYTAHCLRATSIQALSDAGVELRHIMFMSGHRNEGSIRSYSRECASSQELVISKTLSSLASASVGKAQDLDVTELNCSNQTSTNMTAQTGSGLIANSVFQNCTFNIHVSSKSDE